MLETFDVWAWLNDQLQNNDFLIAGLAATLTFVARRLPAQLWFAVKKRVTITVEINSDNPYFVPVAEELDRKSIKPLSRAKVLDFSRLTIGYATSVGIFGGRLVIITREKEESDSDAFKQNIRLVFPFSSHKKVTAIFDSFIEKYKERHENFVRVYNIKHDYTQLVNVLPKRKRETVYVSEKVLERIERRLEFFINNKEWYLDRGVPYKHNILLYGPPGNGKTTLVRYLAGRYGYSIAMSTPERAENALSAVAPEDPNNDYPGRRNGSEKMALLLEDIDCFNMTKTREQNDKQEKGKVSLHNLSTLLNVLDGVGSVNGMLVFATTNNIDDLDGALTRRGRFDDIVYIGLLGDAEIKKMLRVFYGSNPIIDAQTFPAWQGSAAQEIVMGGDLDAAIRELMGNID